LTTLQSSGKEVVLMVTYETFNLVLLFSMFTLTLISLTIVIVKAIVERKK